MSLASEPQGTLRQLHSLVKQGVVRPKDWSDADLAAFAIAGDLRLVSFDRDFARFPGLDLLHLDGT